MRLIADNADSFGATYTDVRKAGTGGGDPILPFNNKIITTSGGDMLATHHKDWTDEARFLAI